MRERHDRFSNLLWAAFPVIAATVFLLGLTVVVYILAASLHGQKIANEAAALARGWEATGRSPLRPRGYIPVLVSVPPISGSGPAAGAFEATQRAVEALTELGSGLEATCVFFAIDSESQRSDANNLVSLLPAGTRSAVLLRQSVLTLEAASAPHHVSAESARVFFLLSVAFEAVEAPSAILIAAKPQGWRPAPAQPAAPSVAAPASVLDGPGMVASRAERERSTPSHPADADQAAGVPAAVTSRALAALPSDKGSLWLSSDALRFLTWASREISRLPAADTYGVIAVDAGARGRSAGFSAAVLENSTAGGWEEAFRGHTDRSERARNAGAFSLAPTADGASFAWSPGQLPDVASLEQVQGAKAFEVGVDGQLMLFPARQWSRLAANWMHARDWRDEVAGLALNQPVSVLAPLVPRLGRGTESAKLAAAVAPRNLDAFEHQQLLLVRGADAEAVINLP
jgi:hypothetical protein